MADLADRLYNCPAGLECGPCRRLIGDLIAVAEAAQRVREYSKQTDEIENPWSYGPIIMVEPGAWFALSDALAALAELERLKAVGLTGATTNATAQARRAEKAEADRDRLTAALEQIAAQGILAADQRIARAELIQIAREALNPGHGE